MTKEGIKEITGRKVRVDNRKFWTLPLLGTYIVIGYDEELHKVIIEGTDENPARFWIEPEYVSTI